MSPSTLSTTPAWSARASRASRFVSIIVAALLSGTDTPLRAAGQDVQQYESIDALWSDFDPRALPIDSEIVKETEEDGLILRTVRYTSEMVDGFTVRVIGYYGFPKGASKLPGVFHAHGGGQNATLDYVRYWARRGYAALSINWGGRPLEGNEANVRTDWGPLRYNQNGEDGDRVYGVTPTARNNSWFHWAIACRRGITFMEQQPEVDCRRIGFFGVSMGGQLTWLVAGTEDRIRCAASVFGLTLLHEGLPGIAGSEYMPSLKGNATWASVLDPYSYAPRIKRPFLFLSSTNDIHARLDKVDLTLRRVPGPDVWQTFSPHHNHRVDGREAATLEMWMDRWLKDGPEWPRSPVLELTADGKADVVVARVSPDSKAPVREVIVRYSTDPYPHARFWRAVPAKREGSVWEAELPLTTVDGGVRVLAHVVPESGPALSSLLGTMSADELAAAGVVATDAPTRLVDDFSRGAVDWFNIDGGPNALLSEREFYGRPGGGRGAGVVWLGDAGDDWRIFTRKVGDPKWRGPDGAELTVELEAEQPNKLVVVVVTNLGRPPIQERSYLAEIHVQGGKRETVVVPLSAFKEAYDGSSLASWSEVSLLGIANRHRVSGKYTKRPDQVVGEDWKGPPPALLRVEWRQLVLR